MYRKHQKSSNLKLMYFPFKFRAEWIRYLLAFGGTDFEDCRISMEDWPKYKEDSPMGSMPILEEDGKQLGQSLTIARYAAKKAGLIPKDEWQAAEADMMVDRMNDLLTNMGGLFKPIMSGDEEKIKEAWLDFKTTHLISFLDMYEKFLMENNTGYLVGNKISWADLMLADFLDRFTSMDPTVLENYNSLNELMTKVLNLPNIKKYIANRPDSLI